MKDNLQTIADIQAQRLQAPIEPPEIEMCGFHGLPIEEIRACGIRKECSEGCAYWYVEGIENEI